MREFKEGFNELLKYHHIQCSDISGITTGHIHQCSISDFISLSNETGLIILEHKHADPKNSLKKRMMNIFPNLFQLVPIFLLTK
jgi:hypothetical protein